MVVGHLEERIASLAFNFRACSAAPSLSPGTTGDCSLCGAGIKLALMSSD